MELSDYGGDNLPNIPSDNIQTGNTTDDNAIKDKTDDKATTTTTTTTKKGKSVRGAD